MTQLRQILGGPGKPRQLLPGQPVRPPARIPQVGSGWPGEAGEGSTRPHRPHPRCSECQHPQGQPRVRGRKQQIRAWGRPWSPSARSRDKTPPSLTGAGTWGRQDGQAGSQAEPQKQKSRLEATSKNLGFLFSPAHTAQTHPTHPTSTPHHPHVTLPSHSPPPDPLPKS